VATAGNQICDSDAERAVLGSLMVGGNDSPDAVAVYAEIEPSAFFHARHVAIFSTCLELYQESTEVDALTVTIRLRANGKLELAGGAASVSELAASVPTIANLPHYARIVRELWCRRQLITAAAVAVQKANDLETPIGVVIDSVAESISSIVTSRSQTEPYTLSTLIRAEFSRLSVESKSSEDKFGVPTGFYGLDEKLCGFQSGDLIVLAGRPSMGKTAFALEISRHASLHADVMTFFCSLEMKDRGLVQRLLASVARIDSQLLRRPRKIGADEWSRISDAAGKLDTRKMLVHDASNVTVLDIRSHARSCKARHGLGLIVVDYLQLVRPAKREQNREREVAEISLGLKGLAKELDVPVLVLAQLNRGVEAREQKRPRLSDLRESGSLEQDADVVLFVHRDGYYDAKKPQDIAEVIIAKQRNGPTGVIEIGWNAKCVSFYNQRVA